MTQKTFGPIVGLDPVVPVGPHPDDDVICSDGTGCKRQHAHIDCRGEPHSNDEDRIEANVSIVTEILDNQVQWADDYCRENEDFATGYDCIISEGHHNWSDGIQNWIWDNYSDDDICKILADNEDEFDFEAIPETDDETAYTFADCIEDNADAVCENKLTAAIVEDIDGAMDCEVVFDGNEYAGYSGPGCCLDGIDIGEQELQISINDSDELCILHNSGELNDCLDDYNGDGYVHRSRRREKNEKTGYYEYVGPSRYDTYPSDHPTLDVIHSPGGRWDWVICQDDMEDYFREALFRLFREALK